MRTTVITGGTGFLGRRLVDALRARGESVVVLGRRATSLGGGVRSEVWTPEHKGPWYQRIAEAKAVVHLAGEPVMNHRWTDAHKDAIYRSRVESTRQIVAAMREAEHRPEVLVCASAVGYYGARDANEVLDEQSSPGHDFLARVVKDWEAAADGAEALGVRVVKLRIGLVLGADGGMLDKMVPAFRMGVGGPVGSGEQMMPWIHLDDAVGLTLLALDRPEARGPINVTAPDPVTMREFASALGRALHRPALLRVPATAVRLMLGEAADAVLSGQRALPRAAQRLGYAFRFPTVDAALDDVFARSA